MPAYEHKSTGCGHRFDLLQSVDAGKTAASEEFDCEAKRAHRPRTAIKCQGGVLLHRQAAAGVQPGPASFQVDLREGRAVEVGGLTGQMKMAHEATPAFLIVTMFLLCLVGAACGTDTGTGTQTQAATLSQSDVDVIESTMQRASEMFAAPGAIVGVWWEGHGEYVMAYGEADLALGREMAAGDLFKAASVSKTVTGNLVLQLSGEGRLSLDDTLSSYDFAGEVTNADRITLRMLLNQTSGLPDPSNESEEMIALEEAEPRHAFTPEEVMAYGEAMPVLSEPGQSYHYSNWNYYLLGMIVERATGMPLEEVVQERFAEPLGLTHTRLDADCSYLLSRPHSDGYVWEGEGAGEGGSGYINATEASTSWTWAAGSITTDIFDCRTWIEAVAKGTLLTPDAYRQQLEVVPRGDGAASDYRQGIIETDGMLWHDGAVPGYSSYAGHNPETGLTVCVFFNVMPGQQPEGAPEGALYMPATLTAQRIIALLEGG